MRTQQNIMRSEPQFGKKLEADHYHQFREGHFLNKSWRMSQKNQSVESNIKKFFFLRNFEIQF